MQLRWLDAARDHRAALKAFTCTDPKKPVWDKLRRAAFHPREWEYTVQLLVHKIKVPVQLPRRILLGFDESGTLRAAIHYTLYDEEDLCWVEFIACDQETRGRGYAAEAFEAMFRDLADLGWTRGYEIAGRIHPKNESSKRAFQRAGGTFCQMDGDLERWSLIIAEQVRTEAAGHA